VSKKALILVVATAMFGLTLAGYFLRQREDFHKLLVGTKPSAALNAFLTPDDLSGQFQVLVSDCYCDLCNEQFHEFHNCIVREGDNGIRGRVLHACDRGMPVTKFSEDIPGGNDSLIVDPSVLYADGVLRRLPKPTLLMMEDGRFVDVVYGKRFSEWLEKNK